MNLIAARSLCGYQDRLDGGPRLTYLPSSCYDDGGFRPKVDKVSLPNGSASAIVESAVAEPVETRPTEPRPSRLRQIVEKIKEVERDLMNAYKKAVSDS